MSHAAILVTNDGGSKSQPGGILGNRDALRKRFALRILSADEAVEVVRKAIRERDDSVIKSQFSHKLKRKRRT